jgi:hypothetical protein
VMTRVTTRSVRTSERAICRWNLLMALSSQSAVDQGDGGEPLDG